MLWCLVRLCQDGLLLLTDLLGSLMLIPRAPVQFAATMPPPPSSGREDQTDWDRQVRQSFEAATSERKGGGAAEEPVQARGGPCVESEEVQQCISLLGGRREFRIWPILEELTTL